MPPKISEWGRKYGTSRDIRSRRSGFTPIDLKFVGLDYTQLTQRQIYQLETIDYQRKKLYGFTTRELQDLDALSERPLKKPNLDNPIISYLTIYEHWHDGGKKWERRVEAPSFPVLKSNEKRNFLGKSRGREGD